MYESGTKKEKMVFLHLVWDGRKKYGGVGKKSPATIYLTLGWSTTRTELLIKKKQYVLNHITLNFYNKIKLIYLLTLLINLMLYYLHTTFFLLIFHIKKIYTLISFNFIY